VQGWIQSPFGNVELAVAAARSGQQFASAITVGKANP
jgi:hypothetical protein